MLRRAADRLIRGPAARVLTGPVGFLVGGLIDIAILSLGSVRARARRRRHH